MQKAQLGTAHRAGAEGRGPGRAESTLPSSTGSFIRSGFVEVCGQQSHPHPLPSLYGSLTLATAVGFREATQPNGINQCFPIPVVYGYQT